MFKSDSKSLQSEACSTDTFNQDRTYAYQSEWVSVICGSLFHESKISVALVLRIIVQSTKLALLQMFQVHSCSNLIL